MAQEGTIHTPTCPRLASGMSLEETVAHSGIAKAQREVDDGRGWSRPLICSGATWSCFEPRSRRTRTCAFSARGVSRSPAWWRRKPACRTGRSGWRSTTGRRRACSRSRRANTAPRGLAGTPSRSSTGRVNRSAWAGTGVAGFEMRQGSASAGSRDGAVGASVARSTRSKTQAKTEVGNFAWGRPPDGDHELGLTNVLTITAEITAELRLVALGWAISHHRGVRRDVPVGAQADRQGRRGLAGLHGRSGAGPLSFAQDSISGLPREPAMAAIVSAASRRRIRPSSYRSGPDPLQRGREPSPGSASG